MDVGNIATSGSGLGFAWRCSESVRQTGDREPNPLNACGDTVSLEIGSAASGVARRGAALQTPDGQEREMNAQIYREGGSQAKLSRKSAIPKVGWRVCW